MMTSSCVSDVVSDTPDPRKKSEEFFQRSKFKGVWVTETSSDANSPPITLDHILEQHLELPGSQTQGHLL